MDLPDARRRNGNREQLHPIQFVALTVRLHPRRDCEEDLRCKANYKARVTAADQPRSGVGWKPLLAAAQHRLLSESTGAGRLPRCSVSAQ